MRIQGENTYDAPSRLFVAYRIHSFIINYKFYFIIIYFLMIDLFFWQFFLIIVLASYMQQ